MTSVQAYEDGNIFAKILRGEMGCHRVFEDDVVLAFMDISPATSGHALVVPRRHARDLLEIEPGDLSATMQAAQRLAHRQQELLAADGVNLLNACGAPAWQTVFHFHVHVIPRTKGDGLRGFFWPRRRYADDTEATEVAARIAAALPADLRPGS